MAFIILAIYLIIIGLNALTGTAIPPWVPGILALLAGVLLLVANVGNWRKLG